MKLIRFLTLTLLTAGGLSRATGADETNIEFFETNIRPLLIEHCYECHGPKEQEAGLRLDSHAAMIRGGQSGPVFSPSQPRASRLLEAVAYNNPDFQMPPEGKLSPERIAALTHWVEIGAPWPDSPAPTAKEIDRGFEITAQQRAFWAFQPPRAVAAPTVAEEDWISSPIDRFVLARLEETGLRPASAADRYAILRRVYLDLIGLPPSPQAIAAFLADERPQALQRVVDRLLASPRFGERWARHWLDVVRFNETAGHVQDLERYDMWRYRDWVIDAFNVDMPYDRFVVAHIAGDLLQRRDSRQTPSPAHWSIATGFLWFHEMHFRPVAPIQQRADQVDAQIDVIGKAFLGLTLACARCHDHKFDPVSQQDYYALAGFLRSTRWRHERVVPQRDPIGGPADERIRAKQKQIDQLLAKAHLSAQAQQSEKTMRDVQLTEDNYSPNERKELARLRGELTALDPTAVFVHTALDVDGRDVHLHIRGSHKNLGPPVPRRFLEILSGDSPPQLGAGSGRLYLAEKITDPGNPLTGRVMVNRVWAHLLGQGLVRTPNNFGYNGQRPTHPELLDHLTLQFVEDGWSIKSLVRRIVLSSTYRMSNVVGRRAGRIDPQNKLLHHLPLRRLEAEEVRDAMLAISGRLDQRMHGQSVPPMVPAYAMANKSIHIPPAGPLDGAGRRSVYLKVRRNFRTPFLETFDFPDPGRSVGRRDVTIVPSQSLAMMNSPLVHQQARQWGSAVASESGTEAEKVARMFLRALSRPAGDEELDAMLAFISAQRKTYRDENAEVQLWADVAHIMFCTNEFVFAP